MKRKYRELETQKPSVRFSAKTDNQVALIRAIEENNIVMAIGPAGCGKTFISASMAARAYRERKVRNIILSRANVPTGRTLGHFPGTVEDKLTPWLMPALDVLRMHLTTEYMYCMEKKVIQLQPLETIRGRSFENSFIIVDEAQNLSVDEIISITTRLGEGSTLVLLGDPFQTDIKGENGLVWFDRIADKYNLNIPTINFHLDDIVRSQIVKDILVALYTEFQAKDK